MVTWARVSATGKVMRFPVVQWWHPLVSVLTAAGVGVVTNLATEEFSWAPSAGLVVLVTAQVGLSVRQAGVDRRDRQVARDGLLGPLRPFVPIQPEVVFDGEPREFSVVGARAVVHWLTAPCSPTPLWGAVRSLP